MCPAVGSLYLGVCSPTPRLSGRCPPPSRSGTRSAGWSGCNGPLWKCWTGRGQVTQYPGSLRIPLMRGHVVKHWQRPLWTRHETTMFGSIADGPLLHSHPSFFFHCGPCDDTLGYEAQKQDFALTAASMQIMNFHLHLWILPQLLISLPCPRLTTWIMLDKNTTTSCELAREYFSFMHLPP